MYFIAVDSHLKWPEAVHMSSTTAAATVNVLQDIFSRLGLPKTLDFDNGPQFIADEFKASLQQNGVKHVTSSPYHLRTNGLTEGFVRSFKTAIKKHSKVTNKEINSFLMRYLITQYATTGDTFAKLLIGRNRRTQLDLLKSDTSDGVCQKQDRMKLSRHTRSIVRSFTSG
jgi:transposase InsO family protein